MAGPRLDLVHKAICGGLWGHISWKDASLSVMLGNPEMKGFTGQGVRLLLRDFVRQGNSLSVKQEERQWWLEEDPDDPFWYRAIIPVPEFPKGLFVEVKLTDDDEAEPWVQIVSAHEQL